MAKYRTRVTEVEAEQFNGFYATPYPAGVQMRDNSNDPKPGEERYHFYTLGIYGQEWPIKAGDYVVDIPGGGFYPVPADVFRTLCEPVEDQ